MTTLSEKIKEALNWNLQTSEYEKKLENYVAATYDAGSEIDFFKIWYDSDKKMAEAAWQVFKKD